MNELLAANGNANPAIIPFSPFPRHLKFLTHKNFLSLVNPAVCSNVIAPQQPHTDLCPSLLYSPPKSIT
uniref:Uncharacterized protein n=1 Tax=Rhizophora mucronata TaxID=61149 RepID=A0A2P2KA30_RHIMU